MHGDARRAQHAGEPRERPGQLLLIVNVSRACLMAHFNMLSVGFCARFYDSLSLSSVIFSSRARPQLFIAPGASFNEAISRNEFYCDDL